MKENERMTWSEIVKNYPARWVFLGDVEWEEEEEVNIASAVLIMVTDDQHVDEMRENFRSKGEHYLVRRTTDSIGIGVINCENFRLEVY